LERESYEPEFEDLVKDGVGSLMRKGDEMEVRRRTVVEGARKITLRFMIIRSKTANRGFAGKKGVICT
jgi:hypothetical protein